MRRFRISVTSSNLLIESWTGQADATGKRSYSAVWLVETNSGSDGPRIVLEQSQAASPDPVPTRLERYSLKNDADNTVVCKDISAARHSDASRFLWKVTANFSPPENNDAPGEGQDNPNPLLRPPRYNVEWVQYTKIIDKDINDKPIVNACKQPFGSPIEQDDARPVLVATKNVATLEEAVILGYTYKNAVNTGVFFGAPARQAKISGITCGQEQTENEIVFRELTIRVEFNDKTWDRSFVNQGYAHWTVAGGGNDELKKTDDNDQPFTEPVKLKPDGTKEDTDVDGNFLTFRTYPEKDFAGLGIGG